VLEGSIGSLGSQYVLGLRARSCTTGDILAAEQGQVPNKEEILDALSQIATRFRKRIGESLATIEKHSVPLTEATTRSLEALKAYSTASKVWLSSGNVASLPLFKRAIALDPDLAMAHAYLGITYTNLGESTLGRQSVERAYQLRDRVSDVERFLIDSYYERTVTGNMERLRQTLESWAQAYPRDPTPHRVMAAMATQSTGHYQRSIEESAKATALDPEIGNAYYIRAYSELFLNRLADAETSVRRAQQRKLEVGDSSLIIRYLIAFLNEDAKTRRRTVALAMEKSSSQDMWWHLEGLVLARSGRLREARRASAVAVQIANQSGQRERAALFEAATAVAEGLYGNAAAARRSAMDALELGRNRDVDYAVAFALAVAGDVSRSRALADGLEKRFAEDTSVQAIYLPALRALDALRSSDPAGAVEYLQAASRYDLGLGGIGYYGFFGALYPVYVRGEAYRAAGRPADAAAEFKRILDHRSIVLVDPMDAIARLQLARALALSGDTATARRAYEGLLALWKDADPMIPIVEDARAEYARLR
jgi:tetratricopeptide (TPR) repeat protein